VDRLRVRRRRQARRRAARIQRRDLAASIKQSLSRRVSELRCQIAPSCADRCGGSRAGYNGQSCQTCGKTLPGRGGRLRGILPPSSIVFCPLHVTAPSVNVYVDTPQFHDRGQLPQSCINNWNTLVFRNLPRQLPVWHDPVFND
jgi:hypothetical protein